MRIRMPCVYNVHPPVMALVLAFLLLCSAASGTSSVAAAATTSPGPPPFPAGASPPPTPKSEVKDRPWTKPTCPIGFRIAGNSSRATCMSLQRGLKTAAAASAYCAFLAVDGTLISADIREDAVLARAFCSSSAAAGQVRFRSHAGASPPASQSCE